MWGRITSRENFPDTAAVARGALAVLGAVAAADVEPARARTNTRVMAKEIQKPACST